MFIIPPFEYIVLPSCLPGVRMGLQQLWSGGLWLHSEPAHTPSGVQLPTEQSGCQYCLWSDIISGSDGQWRGDCSVHTRVTEYKEGYPV